MTIKEICIMGLGYIGLPTAAAFSEHYKVYGCDPVKERIDKINKRTLVMDEEGLKEKIDKALDEKRLEVFDHIHKADMYIICVGTPFKEDKTPDLCYVKKASEDIASVLKKGDTVVLESTCPPDTTNGIVKPILESSGLKVGQDIYLAHSPERVIPGNILYELRNNHRVIGGYDEKSADIVIDVYKKIVDAEIYKTDATTAEMCKLLENTYRDVNIALANETLKMCESLNVNVWDLVALANKHPRVNVHTPGPGVGGHCISVDPWFLVYADKTNSRIVKLSRDINDSMPYYTADRVKKLIHKGEKIAILGSSFKPDVDDFRESPISTIISLLKDDYEVAVYDPHKFDNKPPFNEFYKESAEQAVKDASLIFLGVNHKKFKELDISGLKKLMKKARIFDSRNFFNADEVIKAGYEYYLLGSGKFD